jgi:mRNA interferase YafQ
VATAGDPPPRVLLTTRAFERDVKRMVKRGLDPGRLRTAIEALRLGRPLEPRYRDHALAGDWKGFRDCHLAPDWLLIYRISDEAVNLARTGSHADLFG